MKYCCIVHTVTLYYLYLMLGGKKPMKDILCPDCKGIKAKKN